MVREKGAWEIGSGGVVEAVGWLPERRYLGRSVFPAVGRGSDVAGPRMLSEGRATYLRSEPIRRAVRIGRGQPLKAHELEVWGYR